MDKETILKSVRILMEYLKLRCKLRHEVFPDFVADECCRKDICSFMLRGGNNIEVYWIPCFGIKVLKQLINDIIKKRIIIIYKTRSPESEKHTNLFNYINTQNCFIEVFSILELQYNIFNNSLSPEVSILNNEEKDEMIAFYGNTNLFPKINKSDNVCRYLSVIEGDVLAFKRDEDGKKYTTLRIVI